MTIKIVFIVSLIVFVSTFAFLKDENLWFINSIIIPLSASICVWILSKLCIKSALLCYFGKYSLQFYTGHLIIMLPIFYAGKVFYSFIPSYLLSYLLIFVIATLITALMVYVERSATKLRILFGL